MAEALAVQDALLREVQAGITVHDLGRPMQVGMPQSPNHPEYRHALSRRHGDMVRADGGSAAADMITLGAHVGTHIDALCHVSHDGLLFDGVDAHGAQVGGRFSRYGAETIAPIVCRGVLLDIAGLHGLTCLEGGREITVEDLDAACARIGVSIEPGDVVLIRSGWGTHWGDKAAYVGAASGVPGVSEAGARWLADKQVHAAGADTIAFERLMPGAGHALLPAHRVLLVEHGIHIIETLDLEQVTHLSSFTFVLAGLPLVGATGSPVRPLAITSAR